MWLDIEMTTADWVSYSDRTFPPDIYPLWLGLMFGLDYD